MGAVSTPTPKDVERALKRLTAEQFTQVCSEIGILEVTLPGGAQADKAAALVERTQGRPDFVVLVRTINRANPHAWHVAPTRNSLWPAMYGAGAFVAILGIGGLVLALVLSASEQASQVTPTPTRTPAPTRTPVPTFTQTSSPTVVPSVTPTASRTPSPTRTRSSNTSTATLKPTETNTSPALPTVSIIYSGIEPQRPLSGYRAASSETVEFRWVLRDGAIAADERFWMRMYNLDGRQVDSYLTNDPWRFAIGGPSNAVGEFTWTVTVVKVDAGNRIVGPLSPESDPWKIEWEP